MQYCKFKKFNLINFFMKKNSKSSKNTKSFLPSLAPTSSCHSPPLASLLTLLKTIIVIVIIIIIHNNYSSAYTVDMSKLPPSPSFVLRGHTCRCSRQPQTPAKSPSFPYSLPSLQLDNSTTSPPIITTATVYVRCAVFSVPRPAASRLVNCLRVLPL